MKNTYIMLLLIVFVGGGLLWWFGVRSEDDADLGTNVSTTENSEAAVDSVDAEPNRVESINLLAVGEYSGSGTAQRSSIDTFLHTVQAKLDPPAEGKFYEGWLVGSSIVSTGMMSLENGQWVINFESDQDLSNHNAVVITEETAANGLDGKPEAHVLEGSF